MIAAEPPESPSPPENPEGRYGRPIGPAAHNGPCGTPLALERGPVLGAVVRLQHQRIGVQVSDPEAIRAATLSDLVALPLANGFLIGIVDEVERHPAPRGQTDSRGEDAVELGVLPVGTLEPASDGPGQTFRRGAVAFPHLGSACHLIDAERMRAFFSLLAEGVAPEERLILGQYVGGQEAWVIADGNRLFQRHVALLGSTGTGKSWSIALMLERAARLNHANVVVFDLHGEYGPLTEEQPGRPPVARGLRVAGPSDLGSDSPELLYLPYWLLGRDELMTLVLNEADPQAADQVFRFSEHVQTLKRIALVDSGRGQAAQTFTTDSPIPYRLDHLIQMLKTDDQEKIVRHPSNRIEPGPYAGRLTGLISRLEARASDPRYGFIFNPPSRTLEFEWLSETAGALLASGAGADGVKIIDVSEVPSAIVPMVVGVLARLIYEVQFWMDPDERSPVCLICDEAHLYLPPQEQSEASHEVALRAFESIAKEGRKYGVALMVVSQRPSDVSRTILSQCNNFIVMRVSNDHDRSVIERLVPESMSDVTGVLPVLDTGEALMIGDALLLPTRFRFDLPLVPPASGTQRYWSLWSTRGSSSQAIAAGADALRNQSRAR